MHAGFMYSQAVSMHICTSGSTAILPSTSPAKQNRLSSVAQRLRLCYSFRTGSHYLNRTGSYREILPEVLAASGPNARIDFSYHLAPMTGAQINDRLARRRGGHQLVQVLHVLQGPQSRGRLRWCPCLYDVG